MAISATQTNLKLGAVIGTEFGATGSNVKISDFYKGKPNVTTDSFFVGNLPTTGQIKFSQFRGTQAGRLRHSYGDAGRLVTIIWNIAFNTPKLRILTQGSGAGGKVRLASNNQYLAGGGGGWARADISGLNNFSRIRFSIAINGGTITGGGGSSLVDTGNTTADVGQGGGVSCNIAADGNSNPVVDGTPLFSMAGSGGLGGTSSSGTVYAGGQGGGWGITNSAPLYLTTVTSEGFSGFSGQGLRNSTNGTSQSSLYANGGAPGSGYSVWADEQGLNPLRRGEGGDAYPNGNAVAQNQAANVTAQGGTNGYVYIYY